MDEDLIQLLGKLLRELDVQITRTRAPSLDKIREHIGAFGWVSADGYAVMLRRCLTDYTPPDDLDPSIGRGVLGEMEVST